MPTLHERIDADYIAAMKARAQQRVGTLRLIKADIQRVGIEKRSSSLDDKEVTQVLNKQAKQCKETIDAAKKANRQDVLTQATEELAIITNYLPEPLSEDAITQLVDEAFQAAGAEATQGQIMKYVMAKAAGAADGKIVSQLVGARLKPTS